MFSSSSSIQFDYPFLQISLGALVDVGDMYLDEKFLDPFSHVHGLALEVVVATYFPVSL
jgi:hypothetical protein